jgi:hypothetical protein
MEILMKYGYRTDKILTRTSVYIKSDLLKYNTQ